MIIFLLDTCVVINYLRDRPEAVEFIRRTATSPAVSVVTTAELYAGIRSASEQARIEELLAHVAICDVDRQIARVGALHCRQYRRSHGVAIRDALIAATAQVHGVRLVTRNVRHFPMLDDVLVPYQ